MNNIKPAFQHTSNEVRISPSNGKPYVNAKNETIKATAKKAFQFGEADRKNNTKSLRDREVRIDPPEDADEDFSIFESLILNADEKKSQNSETLDTAHEIESEISEVVQEVKTQQEIEAEQASNLEEVFASEATLENVEVILEKKMVSLERSHALLDQMMGNGKVLLENATVDIRYQNTTVTKFVKDATAEELRNAKPEDYGVVVGDRHFRHPKSGFKAGDTVTLSIDGKQVQLRVEHMRADQVAKFESIHQEYVEFRLSNKPDQEQKDNHKLVEDNFIAERLKPKDLRHEPEKEKTIPRRGGSILMSRFEVDKQADENAVRAKDAEKADEKADRLRKEVVKKEIRHQEDMKENDTVTVVQVSTHKTVKDQTYLEKTATKNLRKTKR